MSLSVAQPAVAERYVYEGRLDEFGQPAQGSYDFRLTPYPDAKAGATLAAPIQFDQVRVERGRFQLEFDAPLADQDQVWLALAVRPAGAEGVFSDLVGRNKALAAPLIGTCWSSTGDTGSDPSTNFLGTIDAQPLVLRAGNAQSLRMEPSSLLFGGLPITANVIAGSSANLALAGARGVVIGGGGADSGADPIYITAPNRVSDDYGVVAGGNANQAGDEAGTAGDAAFATVSGGHFNSATAFFSVIAGGSNNRATGQFSSIGGGKGNFATASGSFVGSGEENTAAGVDSTVSGGGRNITVGTFSAIVGGLQNTARGTNSAVGGGADNCAGGTSAWAGGTRAKVRIGTGVGSNGFSCLSSPNSGTASGDAGTFIWADSQDADFISRSSNSFLVRAQSGMTLQRASGLVSAPRGYLNVVRGDSGVTPNANPSPTVLGSFENDEDAFLVISTPATNTRGLIFRSPASTNDAGMVYAGAAGGLQFLSGGSSRLTVASTGQVSLTTLGSAGSISLCRNASNQIASCSSSARYKHDVADLDLGLEAILRLRPVSYRWNDNNSADVGFIAEEVAALDERLVTRNDDGQVEGVRYERLSALFANAVQQLAAEGSVQADRVAALSAENAELKARLQRIEARLGLTEGR
ncbi:MAG: tail fiber domain-containing protein [Xanthomonadales bacterium]|nr:tail fiber domain-containing protein [Xanthomonadales bacterium]